MVTENGVSEPQLRDQHGLAKITMRSERNGGNLNPVEKLHRQLQVAAKGWEIGLS
jgi:hypothetical protein